MSLKARRLPLLLATTFLAPTLYRAGDFADKRISTRDPNTRRIKGPLDDLRPSQLLATSFVALLSLWSLAPGQVRKSVRKDYSRLGQILSLYLTRFQYTLAEDALCHAQDFQREDCGQALSTSGESISVFEPRSNWHLARYLPSEIAVSLSAAGRGLSLADQAQKDRLIKDITMRANVMFLWASLVVQRLQTSPDVSDEYRAAQEFCRELSPESASLLSILAISDLEPQVIEAYTFAGERFSHANSTTWKSIMQRAPAESRIVRKLLRRQAERAHLHSVFNRIDEHVDAAQSVFSHNEVSGGRVHFGHSFVSHTHHETIIINL